MSKNNTVKTQYLHSTDCTLCRHQYTHTSTDNTFETCFLKADSLTLILSFIVQRFSLTLNLTNPHPSHDPDPIISPTLTLILSH